MPSIIKVLGDEVDITSANTVSDARLVRVYATNVATITVGSVGSFTMPAGSVQYVEKASTDTLTASNTAVACAVSYKA
jgi:hypothetical protein